MNEININANGVAINDTFVTSEARAHFRAALEAEFKAEVEQAPNGHSTYAWKLEQAINALEADE